MAINVADTDAAKMEVYQDEVKKNRPKHSMIPKRPPPNGIPKIAASYATRKLSQGEYNELYYFSNPGLAEASRSAISLPDDESLNPISDLLTNSLRFVPAAAKRSPSSFIHAKDLELEDFLAAVPRMLAAMEQANWTHEHISMLARFWQALCDHKFQSNNNAINRKGLLIYQAEQWIVWHNAILSTASGGAWDIYQ